MRILLIGGTGTFGQAFLKVANERSHLSTFWVTTISRCEHQLGVVQRERTIVDPILGDITNTNFLTSLDLEPYLFVVYAAAAKSVHTCQDNHLRALATNTLPLIPLVEMCSKEAIPLIYLSTDKAVEPINFYGKTKLLAEDIVLSYDRGNVVRYGNVMASRGSVVERWLSSDPKDHWLPEGHVTRYWLSSRLAAVSAFELGLVYSGIIPQSPTYSIRHNLHIPYCGSASLDKVYSALVGPPEGVKRKLIERYEKPFEKLHPTGYGVQHMRDKFANTPERTTWMLNSHLPSEMGEAEILEIFNETRMYSTWPTSSLSPYTNSAPKKE